MCIVQGIECVLYMYAKYIVPGVLILAYRVYIVYHTDCAVVILHQNQEEKENLDIKSDLI